MFNKGIKRIMKVFVALLIVVAVTMGTYTLYASIAPSLAVNRATRNLGNEISERIATTPFQAFGMALNSLNSGSITLDISGYETGRWGSTETDVYLQLLVDAENNEYALYGDIVENGERIDFIAYLNRDRIAINTSLLGDDFYGIDLNTFIADLESLNDLLELTDDELAMIENFVYSFLEQLWQEPMDTGEYVAALVRTLLAAEQVVNEVPTPSGNGTPVMRVEYALSMETLFELLDEWLDVFENDPAIQLQFNNFLASAIYGINIVEELVNEARYELQYIQNDIDGNINLAFYIGEDNRLLYVELDVDLMAYQRVWFNILLDLGASALDVWHVDVNWYDFRGYHSFYATWEIAYEYGVYTNIITLSFDGGHETVTLKSEWDTANGAFTLSYVDAHPIWGSEGELSGFFSTDGETFRLWFEYSNYWYSYVMDWAALDAFWDAFEDSEYEDFYYDVDPWFLFSTRHKFESMFSVEVSTTVGTPEFEDIEFIGINEWFRLL